MNDVDKITLITINENGDSEEKILTKKNLVRSMPDLERRHFKILDPNIKLRTSTITRVGNLILLKLDFFRCYISDNEINVVIPNKDTNHIIIDLEINRFVQMINDRLSDGELDNDKFKWIVIEQIFELIASNFKNEIDELMPDFNSISGNLFDDSPCIFTTEKYLEMRINFLKMKIRIEDICNEFDELIPDDKERDFDEDGDVEDRLEQGPFIDLVETYSAQFEEYRNEIDKMHQISEVVIDINDAQLDVKRNRMQLVSLNLEIIALSVAIAALISGIFGMNLKNGYENSKSTFSGICVMIITIIAAPIVFLKFINKYILKSG
jgi:magnesium transporter